jgi:hypothetical protein
MLSFRRCIFALCGLLFGAGLCAAPARPHIETGEIAGARYAVAIPAKWNHTLLLVAHDYRPESAPLQADLRLDDPSTARSSRKAGWSRAPVSGATDSSSAMRLRISTRSVTC